MVGERKRKITPRADDNHIFRLDALLNLPLMDKNIYILFSIVVLAVIAIFYFILFKHKKGKGLSPLAGLAFGLMLAGLVFGENRIVGFGFIGVGVILAIADIFIKIRK
jgi:preprotein translocase subunit SecG